MKKTTFGPSEVADSMAAAAARLGVPLAAVKRAKQSGCTAFRGSRVFLRELAEAIRSTLHDMEHDGDRFEGPSACEVLLAMAEQIAARLTAVKVSAAEAHKLTIKVHEGFGAAVLVLEPSNVDRFLERSASLFEQRPAARRRGPLRGNNGNSGNEI